MPRLRERVPDRVALARAADEEVVDVARLVLRDLHELAQTELGVARSGGATPFVPAGELRQEDRAGTRPAARRAASCSRRGRTPACRSSRGRRGASTRSASSSSSVATSPPSPRQKRFFVGIEAERRDRAVLARPRARRRPAPRPRARGRRARRSGRTSIIRPNRCTGMIARVRSVTFAAASSRSRLSVTGSISAKTGVAPRRDDRLGGRVEGEGGADDLVARPDAERLEGEHERVGAVGDADRPLHAEVRGCLLLERPVVLAADEAPCRRAPRGTRPRAGGSAARIRLERQREESSARGATLAAATPTVDQIRRRIRMPATTRVLRRSGSRDRIRS